MNLNYEPNRGTIFGGKNMSSVSEKFKYLLLLLILLLLALPTTAAEQKDWKRFRFELEGGPVWQAKNDVRIPGNTGTEFSFKDLIGSGPYAAGRFTFDWNIFRTARITVRSGAAED
jgi:hypothetical protein